MQTSDMVSLFPKSKFMQDTQKFSDSLKESKGPKKSYSKCCGAFIAYFEPDICSICGKDPCEVTL